jgi:hypothetical protein
LPILLFYCFWCHFVLSYSVSSVLFCESARNLTKHYRRHRQRRSWSKATSFFLPSVDSLSSALSSNIYLCIQIHTVHHISVPHKTQIVSDRDSISGARLLFEFEYADVQKSAAKYSPRGMVFNP